MLPAPVNLTGRFSIGVRLATGRAGKILFDRMLTYRAAHPPPITNEPHSPNGE
jgi:hypothetical protein